MAYITDSRPDIVYPIRQNNIGTHAGRIASASKGLIKTDKVVNGAEGDGYKILRAGHEIGGAVYSGGKIRTTCAAKAGDELRLTRDATLSELVRLKIKNCDKIIKSKEYVKILRKNHCNVSDIVFDGYPLPQNCTVLCLNENCDATLAKHADIVIFSPCDYSADLKNYVGKLDCPVLLDMPPEARNGDTSMLKRLIKCDIFCGYVANNVYALELCKNKRVLFGAQMNMLNDIIDVPRIASFEAAIAEDEIVYAYGKQTLMNFTHCPAMQLGYNCGNCSAANDMSLRDETGNVFNLRKRKLTFCYYEMINGKITNLFPKLSFARNKRILVDARNVDKGRVLKALTLKYNITFDEKHETYGRWGKGVK